MPYLWLPEQLRGNLMTNKIAIYNAETQETEVRDMTVEEIAAYNAQMNSAISVEDLVAAKEALEIKKQEILSKLGLTADEVTALLA